MLAVKESPTLARSVYDVQLYDPCWSLSSGIVTTQAVKQIETVHRRSIKILRENGNAIFLSPPALVFFGVAFKLQNEKLLILVLYNGSN